MCSPIGGSVDPDGGFRFGKAGATKVIQDFESGIGVGNCSRGSPCGCCRSFPMRDGLPMIEHVISSLNVNESVSSGSSQPIVNFEAQDKKDRADRVAAYRRQKNAEVRREQLLFLVGLWPIAIGCVLALFAPQLRDILTPNHPWALRLVFPLVSIAARPELHLGSTLASILPGFL